jgi:hypothetical protein
MHARSAADGALGWKTERLRVLRPFRKHHLDDLRDHVARALDHDGVTHADVLALELVLVVQRGVRDGDATNRHGAQLRHGRESSGAPDVHFDAFDHRRGLLRRELERDGPAR